MNISWNYLIFPPHHGRQYFFQLKLTGFIKYYKIKNSFLQWKYGTTCIRISHYHRKNLFEKFYICSYNFPQCVYFSIFCIFSKIIQHFYVIFFSHWTKCSSSCFLPVLFYLILLVINYKFIMLKQFSYIYWIIPVHFTFHIAIL